MAVPVRPAGGAITATPADLFLLTAARPRNRKARPARGSEATPRAVCLTGRPFKRDAIFITCDADQSGRTTPPVIKDIKARKQNQIMLNVEGTRALQQVVITFRPDA